MTPASNTMANNDVVEQLSALMDGELPETEARFLLRRLESDPELRALWARMQLGSQCLRAQPWRVVDDGFADRVAAAVGPAAIHGKGRPLLRYAIAASVAALALMMAPRLMQREAAQPSTIAEVPAPTVDHIVPTPGTADLVALRAPAAAVAPAADAATAVAAADAPLLAANEPSDRATPLPLSATAAGDSPTDFPLVETAAARGWPRSEFAGASNDPAIEAYLVRHNQMLADDGLGGFVPYVDVVANGRPAAAADDEDASAAATTASGEGDRQ